MKIWHDDIRRPPDESWEWVRTNDEAKVFLRNEDRLLKKVTAISLDHDLGLENEDPDTYHNSVGHSPNGNGYDLVCWMIDNNLVPPKITIHSWNPVGTLRMLTELNDHGHDVILQRAAARVTK